MEKKSIIALVLITVILIMWMMWMESIRKVPAPDIIDTLDLQSSEVVEDTNITKDSPNELNDMLDKDVPTELNMQTLDSLERIRKYGGIFADFTKGEEQTITIENNLYKATMSNRGASIVQWELKNYKNWHGAPVKLIGYTERQLFLSFFTFDGVRIDTRDLYFSSSNNLKHIDLTKQDSVTLTFTLDISSNKSLVRTFTFYNDKYDINTDIILNNLDDYIPKRGYNFVWENGLKYQEENSVDESQDSKAIAVMNGNFSKVEASKVGEPVEASYTGVIDYYAAKVKYFGAAIVPLPFRSIDGTIDLAGEKFAVPNNGSYDEYTIALRIPYNGGVQKQSFMLYLGPLDYSLLRTYGYELQEMVNMGWRYGIKQINEYLLLPLFKFIHRFVPNYGITLILFSIFIKILLYPLTIQQMKSAQKMKLLGPEMEKIRQKYKDDNTKQQREIMSLYTTYGINPAGGCLPMLMQMPILFALWQFLRSVIDLRQTPFIWWIDDLSVPDKIVEFGFSIIGLEHISGLALLMGVTMFFQQKLTITDPRQKGLVYIMPIMFTFLFSYFPAGLNLYYFMFNLLSIGQQVYMNKFAKNRPTLDDLRKKPKKESWLQRKMREAQDMAEAQGRSLPGQSKLKNIGTQKANQSQTKSKPNIKKKKK